MVNMTSAVNGYTRLEFKVPSRGIIGLRNEFMTETRGNGIMNHVLVGYEKYKGDIVERNRGSLVVFEFWRVYWIWIIQCTRKRKIIYRTRSSSISRNGLWRMFKK